MSAAQRRDADWVDACAASAVAAREAWVACRRADGLVHLVVSTARGSMSVRVRAACWMLEAAVVLGMLASTRSTCVAAFSEEGDRWVYGVGGDEP